MALDIAKYAAQAAELEDQTEVVQNDFPDRRTTPAGKSVARLISYVEFGLQKQKPFQGKEKPDADNVRVVFELLSSHNLTEFEADGVKKNIADRHSLVIKKSLGTKAAYRQLFDKMRYGRDSIKHMAQMIGEPFIITTVHNKVEATKDKAEKTYANMRDKQAWLIEAPFVVDPLSNKSTDISSSVPPAITDYQLFLWDLANKEMWDSLFIDGTTEIKDAEGKVTGTRSKNWMQEQLLQATNFSGSPLEAILGGLGKLALPDFADPLTAVTNGAPAPAAASAASAPPTTAPVTAQATVAPVLTPVEQIPLPPGMSLADYQAFLASKPAASAPPAPPSSTEQPKRVRRTKAQIAADEAAKVASVPTAAPINVPLVTGAAPIVPSTSALPELSPPVVTPTDAVNAVMAQLGLG